MVSREHRLGQEHRAGPCSAWCGCDRVTVVVGTFGWHGPATVPAAPGLTGGGVPVASQCLSSRSRLDPLPTVSQYRSATVGRTLAELCRSPVARSADDDRDVRAIGAEQALLRTRRAVA